MTRPAPTYVPDVLTLVMDLLDRAWNAAEVAQQASVVADEAQGLHLARDQQQGLDLVIEALLTALHEVAGDLTRWLAHQGATK